MQIRQFPPISQYKYLPSQKTLYIIITKYIHHLKKYFQVRASAMKVIMKLLLYPKTNETVVNCLSYYALYSNSHYSCLVIPGKVLQEFNIVT
jgi:ribosomal protein L18E